jgi:hypothetical protein
VRDAVASLYLKPAVLIAVFGASLYCLVQDAKCWDTANDLEYDIQYNLRPDGQPDSLFYLPLVGRTVPTTQEVVHAQHAVEIWGDAAAATFLVGAGIGGWWILQWLRRRKESRRPGFEVIQR